MPAHGQPAPAATIDQSSSHAKRDSLQAPAAGVCEQVAPQVEDERAPSDAQSMTSEEKRSADDRMSPPSSAIKRTSLRGDDEEKDGGAVGRDVKEAVVEVVPTDSDFPDGGYGWVIVACCFGMSMVMWGLNSSFGVLLSFFLANDYYPAATDLDFAFIGGLSLSLAMLMGPLSNWISKSYGTRVTMVIGMILLSLGQILSSWTTRVWQLFLTQGVMFGFGLGNLMVSSSPIVAQYFQKRRAFALSLVGAGSGAGGLYFSNMSRYLIEKVGLPWTYRINGLTSIGVLLPCIALVKNRNKPLKVKFRPFEYQLFQNKGFVTLVVWGIFIQLAYTIGLYSIPNYAVAGIGLSQTQGAAIQSILSAGQLTGRPLCGLLLDRIGRINGAAIVTVCAGLSCLLIWMFAESFAVLAVFAWCQGATSGIFWTSNNALLTEVLGIRSLNSGLSMLWLAIVLPATVAEPIALLLAQHARDQGRTGTSAYTYSIAFAGTMFVCSGLSLIGTKYYKQQRSMKWLQKT